MFDCADVSYNSVGVSVFLLPVMPVRTSTVSAKQEKPELRF